jgi:hypothetical protein
MDAALNKQAVEQLAEKNASKYLPVADIPQAPSAPPTPPVKPLITSEQQAKLVRSNDISAGYSMEVLRGLMNSGVKKNGNDNKTFQPETVDHAIAALYQAADVSNGNEPRNVSPQGIASEKIDAPFKDVLKVFEVPQTDQNATTLTQMVLEAADNAPKDTKQGFIKLTDKWSYPVNSGKVTVAAFKQRTVDEQCANAETPIISDPDLRKQLQSVFTHNQKNKNGNSYSDKVTLSEGKIIGNNLGDRYCQDRGALPITVTTKKSVVGIQ